MFLYFGSLQSHFETPTLKLVWFPWYMDWLSTCEKFHVAHRYFEILLVICLLFNLYFPRWVLICITIVKFNINFKNTSNHKFQSAQRGKKSLQTGNRSRRRVFGMEYEKITGILGKGKGKVHAFPLRKLFLVTRLCLSLFIPRYTFWKHSVCPRRTLIGSDVVYSEKKKTEWKKTK